MIERQPAHMGAELETGCAHPVGPADLGNRRIDIVQRQRGDSARPSFISRIRSTASVPSARSSIGGIDGVSNCR
jgi:hypothetical protein